MKVLTFDPSGNYGAKEGYGTTGWALFVDGELTTFSDISAKDFNTKQEYFFFHRELIECQFPNTIVCESYDLFGNKAKEQTGSDLGTAQLVGYIMMIAHELNIKFVLQPPSYKARVTDEILTRSGVFEKKGTRYYCKGELTNMHKRDSIRHGIFFHRFNKEWKAYEKNKASE